MVITESLGAFDACREFCNELLFDGYGCTKVAYGLDSVFSFYRNVNSPDGLVVCVGNKCTHIIPIADGHPKLENARRLNVGGFHLQEFLLRLLQLKYPTFPYKLTFGESSMFVYEHCRFATDYLGELKESLGRDNSVSIQFSCPEESREGIEEKKARQAKEMQKKKEVAQKMREQFAEKRKQKLLEYEKELEEFTALHDLGKADSAAFGKRLAYLEFDSRDDLLRSIVKIRESINSMREKLSLEKLPFRQEFDKMPAGSGSLDYSLLEVPDEDLEEAELKEKRRLKMIKCANEARDRIKRQKELAMKEREEKERAENELRSKDIAQYLSLLHLKRSSLLRKKQARTERSNPTNRLKTLASMVEEDRSASSSASATSALKRKKSKHGLKKKPAADGHGSEEEDHFGENDADWSVYRDLSKDLESSDEDDLSEELARIEGLLLKHDHNFAPLPDELAEKGLFFSADHSELFQKYIFGPEGPSHPRELADYYKISLNVERIRVPEILFQPHMAGVDQSGISETIVQILGLYGEETRRRMAMGIYACGSPCRIPGLRERLLKDIRSSLPVEWDLEVKVSSDPLDAWRGASKWASENMDREEHWVVGHKSNQSSRNRYCH